MDMDGVNEVDQGDSLQRPHVRFLDLNSLPEEGSFTEAQLRRQEYQHFERQCNQVADCLFLSGDAAARNRELLQHHGITHVLNCVGFICKEYYKDLCSYKTYYLQDSPGEDILCVLYDALEFISEAIKAGGRVLVHCSQGVSRSATLVIAYLMWKSGKSYDEVFAHVKAARGVANPNIGFTCQLLQWQKRRQLQGPDRMRMYRITPHCAQSPFTLVPKAVPFPKQYPSHTFRQLDQRGAFIIHAADRVYIWAGSFCPPAFAAAARHHAKLLLKYEHPQLLQRRQSMHEAAILEVCQGQEPEELVALLDPALLDPEAARLNARRMSIAEELANSSTPCFPADDIHTSMEDVHIGFLEGPLAGGSGSSGCGQLSGGVPQACPASPACLHGSSMLQQAGTFTPAQVTPFSNSTWVIGEADEYSRDYGLYHEAVRRSSGGEAADEAAGGDVLREVLTVSPPRRFARTISSIAESDSSASPSPTNHRVSRTISSIVPDSPATAEGRLKKYRRSESELRFSSSVRARPLPILHISIGDDEMKV